MADLPAKLCGSRSRVSLPCGDVPPASAMKEFVESGIVPLLFHDTIGGTELDILLDRGVAASCGRQCEEGGSIFKVAGSLELDGVALRAEAEIDPNTMTGWGQLFYAQDLSAGEVRRSTPLP